VSQDYSPKPEPINCPAPQATEPLLDKAVDELDYVSRYKCAARGCSIYPNAMLQREQQATIGFQTCSLRYTGVPPMHRPSS